MSGKLQCAEFEEVAVLYAAGELDEESRASVEDHVKTCASCATLLTEVAELFSAATKRPEPADRLDPSGLLLAQCRSELAEALDDEADDAALGPGWLGWFAPARWAAEMRRSLSFHPGWSAAALLLMGALSGTWFRVMYVQNSITPQGAPVMTVSALPHITEEDLATMGVEGIRFDPQNAGTRVEVRLHPDGSLVMKGSADDAEVRRVLSYVVQHGQRFDPAVRLDSIDLLRTHMKDPQVRAAVCAAAQRDGNPAVRLKATEALRGLANDPSVRRTMLAILAEDDNSGVRVEAVNGLLEALEADTAGAFFVPDGDSHAEEILRDRMQHDPNQYVRQSSAAALGQLASFDSDAGGRTWYPQP